MPAFKDYRSDRLSPSAMGAWERTCAEAISDGKMTVKSYNHVLALFHLILTWARKRGQRYLAHDPLADVTRLRVVRVERDFLEPADITTLIAAAEAPAD